MTFNEWRDQAATLGDKRFTRPLDITGRRVQVGDRVRTTPGLGDHPWEGEVLAVGADARVPNQVKVLTPAGGATSAAGFCWEVVS